MAEKKPLLIVGTFLSAHAGKRSVCEDLAEKLSQSGRKVLTTSQALNPLARLLDMAWTVLSARNTFQIAQVDLYSGRAFVWAEVVCFLLTWLHKPFVLTLHGGSLPEFARRWPRRTRRLLNAAAKVTAPSHYLLSALQPYRSDIQLLPNPIQVDEFTYRPRTSATPKLVWVRSFHNVYNPTLAPKAIAKLKTRYPNIRLWMVGSDKGDGSLQATQAMARSLNVADAIEFPGGVPKGEISQWLNKGDIFINTTHVDNTPVSVVEAMACGLCVISTNVGGIPHLLRDEHDALLVEPDNPTAMADAIHRILASPQFASMLSLNARNRAILLDWSSILPQWDALFQEIAN